MDEEFQTVCDDNSIKEISIYLIKYLNMLKSGNVQQIQLELSQLPACDKWIVPGRKINFVSQPEDDSSSDDDDDDAMDVVISENTSAPSTSGSTMQMEEQDVDPGWTMVKGKKRK